MLGMSPCFGHVVTWQRAARPGGPVVYGDVSGVGVRATVGEGQKWLVKL